MNKIIKKRLALIQSGTIPHGYKKTKAGIMPEDWDGAVRAKDVFKNHTDKKHNGDLEILAATQENGIVPRSQIGIDIQCSEEGVNGYKKVSKGDFVISLRSFQGGIEYSEYDGIVSPAYTVLRPVREISDGYYRNYFKTDSFIQRLNGAVYGIRDGKQIGYQDFGDMYIHCPPVDEQKKIAEILEQCDKVIELKKRNIAEMTTGREGLLNSVFPKIGFNLPATRFPEFSEPWKTKKIGELTQVLSASRVHKEDWRNEGVPFFRSSDVVAAFKGEENKKAFISPELFEKLASVSGKPEQGDIFVTGGGSVGTPYIVPNNNPLYSKDADLIWIKRCKELNPYFVFTYFTSPEYKKYLSSIAHTGTISHYTIEQVKATPIMFPTIEEQNKIEQFFKHIDTLLRNYQKELAEAITMKCALSQLLLTGIVRVKP